MAWIAFVKDSRKCLLRSEM